MAKQVRRRRQPTPGPSFCFSRSAIAGGAAIAHVWVYPLKTSKNHIFRRKIYAELLEWKEKRSREYALLLEGARRVGKTTIVKEFAKNEYRSSIIIDLADNKGNIRRILQNCSGDYDRLFLFIQEIFGTKLYLHESLIVFDEV